MSQSEKLKHDYFFDAKKTINAISVNSSEKFCIVACSDEIKLIKIENVNVFEEINSLKNFTKGNIITDIAWSKIDSTRFACSLSDGSVVFMVFNEGSTAKKSIQTQWYGLKIAPCGINKINWHPSEMNNVGIACNNGSLIIIDSKKKTHEVYRCGVNSPLRDFHFNYLNHDLIADVADNGTFKVWNWRKAPRKPIIMKPNAHGNQPIISVSWNPVSETCIATGTKDRSIKIWQMICRSSVESNKSIGIDSTTLDSNNLPKLYEDLNCTHTIFTSSEVSRIQWRSAGSRSFTQFATSGGHDNGNISLWDIDLNPNVPLCILKGHGNDSCADFHWYDSTTTTSTSNRLEADVKKASNDQTKLSSNQSTTQSSSSSISNLMKLPFFKSSTEYNTVPTTKKFSANEDLNPAFRILSCSRDGKVMFQDIRDGFFPYEHISRSVVAISSKGHVAFHRAMNPFEMAAKSRHSLLQMEGDHSSKPVTEHQSIINMKRSSWPHHTTSLPSLKAEAESSLVISHYSDHDKSSRHEVDFNENGRESLTPSSFKADDDYEERTLSELGVVYIGRALIKELQIAQGIRSIRGAEAGVFDPALIKILAENYTTGYTTYDENPRLGGQDQNDEHRLMDHCRWACQHNMKVAMEAGLQCRTAVWSTALSLLPRSGVDQHDLTTTRGVETSLSVKRQLRLNDLGSSTKGGVINVMPFANHLLSSLMKELLENGDSQHFVVLCEVIRMAQLLPQISLIGNIEDLRIQRTYLCYIDLLRKLELFNEATEIIKTSEYPNIAKITQLSVYIKTQCGKCMKKDLPANFQTPWCTTCEQCSVICVVCHRPVYTLLHWCPICAHGGHLECTRKWFQLFRTCPAGCAHDCCQIKNSNHKIAVDEECIEQYQYMYSHLLPSSISKLVGSPRKFNRFYNKDKAKYYSNVFTKLSPKEKRKFSRSMLSSMRKQLYE